MDDAARFVQSVPREQLMPFVDEVPSVVFCAAHNGHASALELVLQIPDFAATLPQTFMGLTAIETAIVTRHYEAVGVLKEYSPDIRLSPEGSLIYFSLLMSIRNTNLFRYYYHYFPAISQTLKRSCGSS
jgi:hypothetical protein